MDLVSKVSKELKKLTELEGLKAPTLDLLKQALINTDQVSRDLFIAKLAFEHGWRSRSSHHELQMHDVFKVFLETDYKNAFERS